MQIQIQKDGRRYYFIGNTYAVKDKLRNAGCKWDPERKAWWTGKADTAATLEGELLSCATPKAQEARFEGVHREDAVIKGKAQYKGRTYLLLWDGETRRGPAAKLAFRDGSKVFWADADAVQITKRYQQPRSIRSLEEYAARMKRERETGECSCYCHREHNAGWPGSILYDGCDRCGCEAC